MLWPTLTITSLPFPRPKRAEWRGLKTSVDPVSAEAKTGKLPADQIVLPVFPASGFSDADTWRLVKWMQTVANQYRGRTLASGPAVE